MIQYSHIGGKLEPYLGYIQSYKLVLGSRTAEARESTDDKVDHQVLALGHHVVDRELATLGIGDLVLGVL